MATYAKLRNARISPQKVRLVADQIRGLPVENAINILSFSNKKAAPIVKKLLESAIANAEHNDSADVDELKVAEIHVDASLTMKRWRARARGRANKILKRGSNLTIAVAETEQ
ncbi:MAG: 50S ribosomal protein L22 [Pseudomonadota bacterium]